MSPGRTTWWACDAAEHDRELIVELGQEHGASGPYLLRVVKDLAQQQRHDGVVRTGFLSLSRKVFCTREQARAIVENAASIGALDDLEIDGDGRRFTCRVSGWSADQTRGREAMKKALQRAGDNGGHVPPEGDNDAVVPPETGHVPEMSLNQTRPNHSTTSSEAERATPEVIRLSGLLADLIRQRDPKAKPNPDSDAWLRPMRLLLDDREGDTADVERVLRWSQADPFWQGNILSPAKLRKQFTQLTIKSKAQPLRAVIDEQHQATRERRAAALASLQQQPEGEVA